MTTEGNRMLAYSGDQNIKDRCMTMASAARAADETFQLDDFRDHRPDKLGMVEAVLGEHDYSLFESVLGMPKPLAFAAVELCEQLGRDAAQSWPERFLSAIAPGSDLTAVWPKFALWILGELLGDAWPDALARERHAVQRVVSLLENGGTKEDWFWAVSRCCDAWKSVSGTPLPGPGRAFTGRMFFTSMCAEWIAQIEENDPDAHPDDPLYGSAVWASKVVADSVSQLGRDWIPAACDTLIALLESAPT